MGHRVLQEHAAIISSPGLAVLLDGGDAGHVGAALVQLPDADGDGVARVQEDVPLVLLLLVQLVLVNVLLR